MFPIHAYGSEEIKKECSQAGFGGMAWVFWTNGARPWFKSWRNAEAISGRLEII